MSRSTWSRYKRGVGVTALKPPDRRPTGARHEEWMSPEVAEPQARPEVPPLLSPVEPREFEPLTP